MAIRVFAPASIGNFIIGFDMMGLAISDERQLGDTVSITPSQQFRFVQKGAYVNQLPQSPTDNLVCKAVDTFHQTITGKAIKVRPFTIELEKSLPVGSGLGSSACSIVAALVALNHFYEQVLTDSELLQLAGQLEAGVSGSIHYDNVAPCLLGGLQFIENNKEAKTWRLDTPAHWQFVICHPGIQISTKAARDILPTRISLSDSITWSQKQSTLMLALERKASDDAIKRLLMDDIIEPARKQLIPGFDALKQQALDVGALAFGISGSGPTMVAIVNNPLSATRVLETFHSHFNSSECMIHLCDTHRNGAHLIT